MLYFFLSKPHLTRVFIRSEIFAAVNNSHAGSGVCPFSHKQDTAAISGLSFREDPVQIDRLLYEVSQDRVFIPLQVVIRRCSDPAVGDESGRIGRRRENALFFPEKGCVKTEVLIDMIGGSNSAVLCFDYCAAPVSTDRVVFLIIDYSAQGSRGKYRVHFKLVNGFALHIGQGRIQVPQHPVDGFQLLCVPASHFIGEDQPVCGHRDCHKGDHQDHRQNYCRNGLSAQKHHPNPFYSDITGKRTPNGSFGSHS